MLACDLDSLRKGVGLADKHPLGVLIYCVAGAVKVFRNKRCNPSCELFS